MSVSSYPQSGTRRGGILPGVASGDLTGKEGYLVKFTGSASGVYPVFAISTASTDKPVFVLNAGSTSGGKIEVIVPAEFTICACLSGTCTTGGLLTASTSGKVQAYASASDTAIGYALSDGVDGQWIEYVPLPPVSATAPTVQTNGTVAAAGTTQGTGTAISAHVTYVTGADGVKGVVLPSAVAGDHYVVYNKDKDPLLLYPYTSDQINNQSANAAIVIPGWSVAICDATDTTVWAVLIASEYRASYANIVAVTAAGSAQGDGLIDCPSGATVNATGGDGTKVVTLPTLGAKTGFWLKVFNNSASNLPVFPPSSVTINGGSTNASVTIATQTLAEFVCIDGTDWAAAEPAKA